MTEDPPEQVGPTLSLWSAQEPMCIRATRVRECGFTGVLSLPGPGVPWATVIAQWLCWSIVSPELVWGR